MARRIFIIVVFGIACIISVYFVIPCDRQERQNETWIHSAAESFRFHTEDNKIDDEYVCEIMTSRQVYAEYLLSKEPVVELSIEQASGLAGKRFTGFDARKPFLVRALYYEGMYTGKLMAFENANAIYVLFGYLGAAGENSLKRTGLVLFLEKKPVEVFVNVEGVY